MVTEKHKSRISLLYDFVFHSDGLSDFLLLLFIIVSSDHQNQSPQDNLLFFSDRS